MAYTPPTAEVFKIRYPEFASVPDALVNLVLNDAISRIGETWVENDRAKAQMLLTAHQLTMEGEPKRSSSGVSPSNSGQGLVKRRKVGDVETEFAGASASLDPSKFGGFGGSFFGQEYWKLLKVNFPSPMVV